MKKNETNQNTGVLEELETLCLADRKRHVTLAAICISLAIAGLIIGFILGGSYGALLGVSICGSIGKCGNTMCSRMSGHCGINIKGESTVKKLIALLFSIIIVISLFAGCDDTNNDTALLFSSPDDDAETEAKPTITADEARAILQTWVDEHPFQLGSEIDPGNDEYTVDGVEYYRFCLGIIRFGVAEILVRKDTGEVFHLTSPYNDVGFESADDWYNREHALNTSGSE